MTLSNEGWADAITQDRSEAEEGSVESGHSHTEWSDSPGSVHKVHVFEEGDHVYKWCDHGPVPKAYTHHGIVIGVADDKMSQTLTILDFSTADARKSSPGKSSSSSSFREPSKDASAKTILSMLTESSKDWQKVRYASSDDERPSFETARGGTCTSAKKSETNEIMARVGFVRNRASFRDQGSSTLVSDCPLPFPSYHCLSANCDCFAVWLATGSWCSLQGLAGAKGLAGFSVIYAATAAAAAGATIPCVTVPAAGVWGWLGFTSTTTVAAAFPLVIPVAVAGSAWLGVRAVNERDKSLRFEWSVTTDTLNSALAEHLLFED